MLITLITQIRDPAHLLIETLFSFQRSTQFLFIILNKNSSLCLIDLIIISKLASQCQQVFELIFKRFEMFDHISMTRTTILTFSLNVNPTFKFFLHKISLPPI